MHFLIICDRLLTIAEWKKVLKLDILGEIELFTVFLQYG